MGWRRIFGLAHPPVPPVTLTQAPVLPDVALPVTLPANAPTNLPDPLPVASPVASNESLSSDHLQVLATSSAPFAQSAHDVIDQPETFSDAESTESSVPIKEEAQAHVSISLSLGTHLLERAPRLPG